ncbi:unnamed protein product [Rhodiola kirilowii]
MIPDVKPTIHLYQNGRDWFYHAALASDIVVIVDGVKFHLHKFPLISRCGKIANLLMKESQDTHDGIFTTVLQDFPGGPDNFLAAVKFCYSLGIELAPRNIVLLFAAADYLEMTDEYGEENLLRKCEVYFHKNILRSWKDCIAALQSCDIMKPVAEKLQLITKCLDAVTTMVCTDASLFGWPMMLYGSLQSPGGSILWNGINTGAKIRSMESDWWFEDISYLSVDMFERLIKTMQAKGIRSENIAGSIMYYGRMHLPGLGRWHGGPSGKSRSVASFSLLPSTVDQKDFIERIEKLLPDKKGKSFCRFVLGLLRNALILGVDQNCRESLERRVGAQLDLATLDGLLIPTYSDSDTLYDTDCVERIVRHFVNTEPVTKPFSPSSFDMEVQAQSTGLIRRVSILFDSYLAEVASDLNLKPEKMFSLIEALPESSRSLHDRLYRALDIYSKEHPWLSDAEKEQLCNLMDYQKLSIDACAHASQNKRLPLRIVLQVLFFEQMQLKSALAGCLHASNTENAPMSAFPSRNPAINIVGQIVHREGWVPVLRKNHVMKVDLKTMRSRVAELEQEFSKMRLEVRRVTSSLSYTHSISRGLGCKLLPSSPSDAIHTPRASLKKEKARKSGFSNQTRRIRNISIS